MFLAAAIQLNSTSNEANNWASFEALARRAARAGAKLVATPECTNYLGPHDRKVQQAEPLDGPTVTRYRQLAQELRVWLLIGSVNERADSDTRCYNTTVVLAPDGRLVASYRKVHLFDVDIPEVRFLESDTTVPGTQPVVADTDLGPIGLSICYDLRFPEHFRTLVDAGAKILAVPSAFTAKTGKAHWEPLLRARAIESQAWVIAPGQVGHHDDDGLRHSHGHSMIVDPWGTVVASCGGDAPGLAIAEIDLDRVAAIRRGMPCAAHRVLGINAPEALPGSEHRAR